MTETIRSQTTAKAAGTTGAAPGFDRGAFYRLCRMLHAYFSAFAFLTLMFFSVTGLILDHPEWMQGRAAETQSKLTVPPAVMQQAQKASDPKAAMASAVAGMTPLVGAYRGGDIEDGQANLRFEGIKGASTILLDVATGQAEVTVEHATPITMIGDLHRGKNASLAWRMVIDLSAIVILILSAIGYVLFFSLRFRLRTSLILTALSLLAMVAVFAFLTP